MAKASLKPRAGSLCDSAEPDRFAAPRDLETTGRRFKTARNRGVTGRGAQCLDAQTGDWEKPKIGFVALGKSVLGMFHRQKETE